MDLSCSTSTHPGYNANFVAFHGPDLYTLVMYVRLTKGLKRAMRISISPFGLLILLVCKLSDNIIEISNIRIPDLFFL